jgi:hypothetical protein
MGWGAETQAFRVMQIAYMEKGKLNDFTELLNLFLETTKVFVCNVWLLLDCHHGYGRVNLGWQWNLNLIFLSINTNAHSFFNISGSNTLTKANNKLGDLLHVNDVFGIIGARVNDLGASSNL